ncbi:hypothetical protein [Microseira sp. BLCC-F43]|uniref:hypothetical protein n=1 Tax=Microseira sp. BLCC-F43 TaxID=3153602 RepID=UPI0035BA98C1
MHGLKDAKTPKGRLSILALVPLARRIPYLNAVELHSASKAILVKPVRKAPVLSTLRSSRKTLICDRNAIDEAILLRQGG